MMKISAPANGATVSGVVTVKVDAPGVSRVNWFVDTLDAAGLRAKDAAAPFTFAWYTTRFPDGPHTIYAISGNGRYRAQIGVIVDNGVPVAHESADKTVVQGTAGSVTDQNGHVWTIGTDGRVYVDHVADAVTGSVVELAYVNHTVYQLNTSGNWYWKAHAEDAWSGPSTVSPLDPTPAPPPPPQPLPAGMPRQGFSNSWPILGRSSADQDKELDACKDLANGKPTFLRLDIWVGDTRFDTVKAKAEARGLTVMALVSFDYAGNPSPPTVDQYAAACAAAAKKCDWVNTCNEPDMVSGWPPELIAARLVAGYKAAKQANPNVTIVGPSTNKTLSQNPADGYAYVQKMLVAANGQPMFDVASFHPYADPLDHGPWNLWDKLFVSAPTIKDLLRQYGFTGPIIATEGGWPHADSGAGKDGLTYQSDTVKNAMDYARTTYGLQSFIVFSVPDDSSPGGYGLKSSAPSGAWSSLPAYAEFKNRAV